MEWQTYAVTKAIEVITSWFNNEKQEQEKKRAVLLALKISLNNVVLHMNLCRKFGHLMHKDMQIYLPSDIENLNNTLMANQALITNEIYDEIMTFVNVLVEYNHEINSLSLGKNLSSFDDKIFDSVKKLIDAIDKLLSE